MNKKMIIAFLEATHLLLSEQTKERQERW